MCLCVCVNDHTLGAPRVVGVGAEAAVVEEVVSALVARAAEDRSLASRLSSGDCGAKANMREPRATLRSTDIHRRASDTVSARSSMGLPLAGDGEG